MSLYHIRKLLLLLCLAGLVACTGPRSEIEVFHLRDLVREGRVEYLNELVNALGSNDDTVRSAAIHSLAELGEAAEPRLKQTVREQDDRSGPALLALGYNGNPENLEFIRTFESNPMLGASAKEAERQIEGQLYKRIQSGELEAMTLYLEAFPDSARAAEIKKVRRDRLAKSSWNNVAASPSVADLEKYLEVYGDSEDASMAKVTLARLLSKEANTHLEAQEFAAARKTAARLKEFDPRREPEAARITAQAWLAEGKSLKAAGKNDEALAALSEASKFLEFHLDADRLRGEIQMSRGRAKIQSGSIREGVILCDEAAELDPVRRPEVAAIKTELALGFQAKIQGTDPVQRRLALVGLMSLGDEAARPMELYLGNLFVKKDYAAVEEVVQALAEARRGTPKDQKNPGVDRVGELLAGYLKAALAASSADVQRLFGSADFIKQWTNEINPLDPREFPLIYKVEELTTRHLGLSRVGLTMKILLGEAGVDFVHGSLLPEEEVRSRLVQGQVGSDATLPLLTRVQLCARYSSAMGEFSRSVETKPERFMAYAVGLTVPPQTAADWLQVAEGYKNALSRNQNLEHASAAELAGGLRTDRAALASLDYDQRSLTVQVYDPVVDQLGTPSVPARAEAANRTLALLLNTSRIAFGLYSGIDRYTVLLGSTETPLSGGAQVRGGRFDPETRMMISQKSLAKIEWQKLRALNGVYGPSELSLVDLQWYRWSK